MNNISLRVQQVGLKKLQKIKENTSLEKKVMEIVEALYFVLSALSLRETYDNNITSL